MVVDRLEHGDGPGGAEAARPARAGPVATPRRAPPGARRSRRPGRGRPARRPARSTSRPARSGPSASSAAGSSSSERTGCGDSSSRRITVVPSATKRPCSALDGPAGTRVAEVAVGVQAGIAGRRRGRSPPEPASPQGRPGREKPLAAARWPGSVRTHVRGTRVRTAGRGARLSGGRTLGDRAAGRDGPAGHGRVAGQPVRRRRARVRPVVAGRAPAGARRDELARPPAPMAGGLGPRLRRARGPAAVAAAHRADVRPARPGAAARLVVDGGGGRQPAPPAGGGGSGAVAPLRPGVRLDRLQLLPERVRQRRPGTGTACATPRSIPSSPS